MNQLSIPTIQVEDITFSYPGPVLALENVSVQIAPGEAVAIVGENGAGKTTLARHLNGLLRPTTGRVLIGDWDTRKYSVAKIASRVGFAFQNPDDQLFERTVRAEVAFGPRNLKLDSTAVDRAVEDALKQVDLLDEADRHPYDLQLSQRKLLALAATLAMQTPIVILDEPTTGQDAPGVECVGRIVDDLIAQGRTVITITHDLDFCAEHFKRVIVMAGAHIVLDGPSQQVLSQTDKLADALVDPPQIMRLASALGMAPAPLTPEQLIDLLAKK